MMKKSLQKIPLSVLGMEYEDSKATLQIHESSIIAF
jgi:hypothetical protein